MRRPAHKYTNLDDLTADRDNVAWYWRLIALAASWMILGGYLILPAAFHDEPKLRFNQSVLTIIVVTLMTTGYSFTGLLCFACPSWYFQAEAIFLPALSSSALGLLTVLWCFASSAHYKLNSAAIITIVLASISSLVYGCLLLWTHRKITMLRSTAKPLSPYSEASFYKNFIANMYPSVRRNPDNLIPLTDEERINQQMAMLLMKSDPGPSPDAGQSTFKINLPDEPEHELGTEMHGVYRPPNGAVSHPALPSPRSRSISDFYNSARGRSENGREQIHHQQQQQYQQQLHHPPQQQQQQQPQYQQQMSAWERNNPRRSRAGSELTVDDASTRGRSAGRESGERSRAVSREERRREIEMGTLQGGTLPR